jgi:hypothetical protein
MLEALGDGVRFGATVNQLHMDLHCDKYSSGTSLSALRSLPVSRACLGVHCQILSLDS